MSNQLILNVDCRSLSFEDMKQIDCMITDPPYSKEVHSKAVSCTGSRGVLSNARKRDLGFDHLSDELREWVGKACGYVKRWSVIYSDIESTHLMRAAARDATYIRTVAWIRWSMPQLSGDRPPSGREDLLIFHRDPSNNWDDSEPISGDMLIRENDPVTDVALFTVKPKERKLGMVREISLIFLISVYAVKVSTEQKNPLIKCLILSIGSLIPVNLCLILLPDPERLHWLAAYWIVAFWVSNWTLNGFNSRTKE